MSKTRKQNTNILLLVAAFVGGIVCNRLMNHQNIVSGDVEEGMDPPPPPPRSAWVIIMISIVFLCLLGVWGVIAYKSAREGKTNSDNPVMNKPFGVAIGFTTVVALIGFWWWNYWHEFVVSGVILFLYFFLPKVGNLQIGTAQPDFTMLNPHNSKYIYGGD